jgi:ABC-type uncharacterized transport system permease subunit
VKALVSIRLVERGPGERGHPLVYGAVGLVLGLLLSLALAALTPAGVGGAARALVSVLTSPTMIILSFPYFAAISLSGVGLALAYRAGFITIGAEGQLILGMVVGFGVAYYSCGGLAGPLALLCAAAAAAFAAGVYGLLVGVLRVWLSTNETLVSLMLNYVAVSVLNYVVSGPWRVGGFTKTAPLPAESTLSPTAAAVIAFLVVVGFELLHHYTRLGVAVDGVGAARRAATTYGVSFARTILVVSFLGGVAAGLGGLLYLVSGAQRLFSTSQGVGYGYIGILAAWLAGLRPIGVAAASLLLALLYVMNTGLQLSGVMVSFVQAMQAVIVVAVTAAVAFSRYKLEIKLG